MDITINVEEYKLNVRTAGIIMHNNKILTHKDNNKEYYALIGGRVQIGEDSETALKREIMEEIGKEIEIIGCISTIENFFKMQGEKYHEIMFVYQVEFVKEEDKKIEEILNNVEGKDYLRYEWIDLDKIEKCPLRPEIIKKVLKNGKFPTHEININKKEE